MIRSCKLGCLHVGASGRWEAPWLGFFLVLLLRLYGSFQLASASTCELEDRDRYRPAEISSDACTETPIDIVLVTDDLYYDRRTTDDFLLARSLAALGRRVERRSYRDANFSWASSRTAVLRSAWELKDSKEDFDDFMHYYDENSSRTAFINYEVDQWTKTKEHYTWDLARAGINTLDFVYITPDNVTTLEDIMSQNSWDALVFKPASHSEVRELVTRENVGKKEPIWQQYSKRDNMVVQNFQSKIAEGEVSIIFIGDVYSHAVLKVPQEGEFDIHVAGGSVYLHEPTDEEMAFAQRVYSAMKQKGFSPAFARIDIVRDNDDALALMEVQIRSAILYLSLYPESAEALALVLDNTIDNVAQTNTCAQNRSPCHGPRGYFDTTQYFFEDEEWDRLPRDVQEAAISLGYTSEKWEDSYFEDEDWEDLSPDQRRLLRILGFTKARVSAVSRTRRPPCD